MRKLYIVLWCSLLLSIAMAAYSTFTSNKPVSIIPLINNQNNNDESDDENILPIEVGEIVRDENIYVLTQHKINGTEYVLTHTGEDPNIYRLLVLVNDKYYALPEKHRWMNSYIDERVNDFWIDEAGKNFYLTRNNIGSDDSYYSNNLELLQIDYSDNKNLREVTLSELDQVEFGRADFIDYNSVNSSFVMSTIGGDACSMWGTIYIFNLNTNNSKEVIDIAGTCMSGTRYLDYKDGKLILGEPVECAASDYVLAGSCLKTIYSIDPFNPNRRDTIYTFNSPYDYDLGYNYDSEIKMSDTEIVLTKIIDLPDTPDGTKNYWGDNYAFDLVTKVMRDIEGDKDNTYATSPFNPNPYNPEPTPTVLRETSSVKITMNANELILYNKTDDAYSFDFVTDNDDIDNWKPCGDGCYSWDEKKDVYVNLGEFYESDSLVLYWWDFHSDPDTVAEVPTQNKLVIR